MEIGDLIRFKDRRDLYLSGADKGKGLGIVIRVDDSHRQTKVDVLFNSGVLKLGVWDGHLEVINETI